METKSEPCVVCAKTTDSEHLLFFGEDAVCADCKDSYVQCLKEGLIPSFERGLWKKGKFVVCESKADLTKYCLTCNSSAALSVKMDLKVIQPFTFHIFGGPKTHIDVGYCKDCRKRLNRYGTFSTVSQVALTIGLGGPMLFGWVNLPGLHYLFLLCLATAFISWLIRICLMREPAGTFQEKTKLIRILNTGSPFRESLSDLPESRIHEFRE